MSQDAGAFRDKITGQMFDPEAMVGLERDLYPNEDEEAMARRLFRQALPSAVMQVITIARTGDNERVRLQAATYVVERVLGKPGEDPTHASANLLQDLVQGFENELKAEVEGRAK